MDLRRLRTFVAVAELGTVSRAALQLRISQSALSRQIIDLEQELDFRLFDRVGRRLILTAIGEQLLGDCRGVLGQVGSLGERVELLRRGDRGVLKVAAPPQTIESVLSTFLPRYAQRFPNVQVKLTEALGHDQSALLERGDVHVGIRHDQYANRHLCKPRIAAGRGFGRVRPIASAGPRRHDRYRPPRVSSAAAAGIGLLDSQGVQCSLPSRRRRTQHSAREPRTAHLACTRRDWAGGCDHSVIAANGSLRAEDRPRNTPAQTASGAISHSVGQPTPNPALCRELLRGACRVHG
jgi:DNA-binding transcriptional LysR family regulator